MKIDLAIALYGLVVIVVMSALGHYAGRLIGYILTGRLNLTGAPSKPQAAPHRIPDPRRIPPGPHTPNRVLELAREHRVVGHLVRVQGPYESRVYAATAPDRPWVVMAEPHRHYVGE